MDLTHNLGAFWVLLAYPAVLIVKAYRFFSPIKQIILGPYAACRFHPTCSEYS
ncbi:MAG: membrane protein insertion efficiency factor YidD, partial [Opitutae bacterium]|nr:membrane protein insertion efficiency factor YidD [Opitutae bacterium]